MFGELITAMVTPFKEDRTVDFESAARLVEHLEKTGTDNIVVCGTTGESPTLTEDEKLKLVEFVINKSSRKVIVGSGSNCTKSTIEFSKKVKDLGAHAIMIVAPYYNKPCSEGLYTHLTEVMTEVNLPTMLYNIPGRTGININVDTMLKISRHPNLVAIKESSGNLSQIANLIKQVDKKVKVYSGDDNLTLPILSVGGFGAVSVASHIIGNQISEMITSFKAGKVEAATKIHLDNLEFCENIFCSPNPVPIKYLLSKLGFCRDTVRLPLVNLSESSKNKISSLL